MEPNEGDEPPPIVRWSTSVQVKKGEDFYHVEPRCESGGVEFGMYCVFDGHNGGSAAAHAKASLGPALAQALALTALSEGGPGGGEGAGGRAAWLQGLPQALAESFLLCNTAFAKKGEASGTTVTVVVVAGWTVTVAAVGDSRAVLDTVGGGVQELSVDHRFEDSKEERERVLKEGGMIARLKTYQGVEVGPLRSWPGGLCVSRSIGDIDCGPQITPLPHVRQIEVPRSGGRIIIASDGLWDAVDSNKVASVSRGLPCTKAADVLVKESIRLRGLRDDVTVVVVDLLPSATSQSDDLACPVPRLKEKKSLWKKLKASTVKKKGQPPSAAPPSPLSPAEGLPNLVNDHDSMKGGTLYERYLKGDFSVHSKNSFCKICGVQVPDGSADTEASVRAGNCFCANHRPAEGAGTNQTAAAGTKGAGVEVRAAAEKTVQS